MTLHRTLLLEPTPNGHGERVVDHQLTEGPLTDAELREWLFGSAETWSFSADMTGIARSDQDPDARGRRVTITGDAAQQPIGHGWLYDGAAFQPPPPPPRIITGTAFLSLFTPAEIGALWTADPRLMAGAMKVMAQDTANLSSPETAQLVALAVAKGVLTRARADQVLRGEPP